MKTSTEEQMSKACALLCVPILCLWLGCSRNGGNPSNNEHGPTAPSGTNIQASITPEQLFGTYIVTDYARFYEDRTPEEKAKARIGTELVISREAFAMRDMVIRSPRYKVRYYEPLPEGEVPEGARRRLSTFYGFWSDRDADTVLEVYDSAGGDRLRRSLEVIDTDTLWDSEYSATWLYQFRRKGASGNAIPLKDRCWK